MSLRHLCRIVECEAISVRETLEALRAVPAVAPLRPAAAAAKESAKESAAFAGQSLSPAE